MNRLMENYDDYTYYVVLVEVLFVVEMCVGISASCMPVLALLTKEHRGKLRSARSTISASLRITLGKGKKLTTSNTTSKRSNLWGSKTPTLTGYAHMSESQNSHEMEFIVPPERSANIVQVSAQTPESQPAPGRDAIYVDFTLSHDVSEAGRIENDVQHTRFPY
jgi:hypothetical protein